MADDFSQRVETLLKQGDTILSTHGGFPALAKKGSVFDWLEIDATSGGLKVDLVDASGITVDVDIYQYQDGDANTSAYGTVAMGDDGTNLQFLSVDSSGQLQLAHDVNSNPVFAKITNGTTELAINTNGSLNVVTTNNDSTWDYGSANLVKDTATSVNSFSPVTGSNKVVGVLISGLGLCEWDIQFGITASEATIAVLHTTPSQPSKMFAFPESIEVQSAETILVEGTNKENAVSPASDFTGHATFIYE